MSLVTLHGFSWYALSMSTPEPLLPMVIGEVCTVTSSRLTLVYLLPNLSAYLLFNLYSARLNRARQSLNLNERHCHSSDSLNCLGIKSDSRNDDTFGIYQKVHADIWPPGV